MWSRCAMGAVTAAQYVINSMFFLVSRENVEWLESAFLERNENFFAMYSQFVCWAIYSLCTLSLRGRFDGREIRCRTKSTLDTAGNWCNAGTDTGSQWNSRDGTLNRWSDAQLIQLWQSDAAAATRRGTVDRAPLPLHQWNRSRSPSPPAEIFLIPNCLHSWTLATRRQRPAALIPHEGIHPIYCGPTDRCHRKFARIYLKIQKPSCRNFRYSRARTVRYSHLNLSTSLPAHIVANATLIENTRILPELSFE